ncbi:DNA-binding protein [Stutzerimonas stutzeri]|uniref:Integrase n=1 Tax=Stutzerimonas stutzeri TaxID=316 RepID=A0A6I6LR01_STUST|nr:DNA-binding protein [Stutzerimonas stutzeri]QGZ31207.1 integrase [Stutzerimonas stutzeri]
MARAGINKAIVQKARQSLLAKGINPSIDAVRNALGNTGSKTTISRYLKEIEARDTKPDSTSESLSKELSALVESLVSRVKEEGTETLVQAQAEFDEQRLALEHEAVARQAELDSLRGQLDTQTAALQLQTQELQTCQSSLQIEITRNARISQSCSDLKLRVQEKHAHIQSLEEKHVHARNALEHYRAAVKEQRDQDQRRHEAQLQQIHTEQRQLQQTLIVKQEELGRLNRDNERLLSEARHYAKTIANQEDLIARQGGEIQSLRLSEAKAFGAKEQLGEHVNALRAEMKRQAETTDDAMRRASESERLLALAQQQFEDMLQGMDREKEATGKASDSKSSKAPRRPRKKTASDTNGAEKPTRGGTVLQCIDSKS